MVPLGSPPELIERLSRDHARIAGIVRDLESLVDTADGSPDWERIVDALAFLDYFADSVHHPLEDRVFDFVTNKGLSPTDRHLVFRNLGQHREIRSLTETLVRDAKIAREGGVVDAGDFLEALATYIALQRRHMRFEESHLFPLLEGTLDISDWNTLSGLIDRGAGDTG